MISGWTVLHLFSNLQCRPILSVSLSQRSSSRCTKRVSSVKSLLSLFLKAAVPYHGRERSWSSLGAATTSMIITTLLSSFPDSHGFPLYYWSWCSALHLCLRQCLRLQDRDSCALVHQPRKHVFTFDANVMEPCKCIGVPSLNLSILSRWKHWT
jgi:hypothetical protein